MAFLAEGPGQDERDGTRPPGAGLVVFFINGIGDHILNLPALRALAQWSGAQMTVICSTHPASRVFDELHARIVRVPHQRSADGGKTFDWWRAIESVGSCDLFVSLAPWSSESLTALLGALAPRMSVGFDSVGAPAFDVRVPLDFTKHSTSLAFDVVNVLWPEAQLSRFLGPPTFGESARRFVRTLKSELPAGTRYLSVHGETLAQKMWPPDRFSAVLSAFFEEHRDFICFLVGTANIGIRCEGFEDRVVSTFTPAAGQPTCWPLPAALSLVADSDLFLGVDSCFLHVADFCRVPTVALFGPTCPHEWGCMLTRNRTLSVDGSLEGIQVDEVLKAMNELAAGVQKTCG